MAGRAVGDAPHHHWTLTMSTSMRWARMAAPGSAGGQGMCSSRRSGATPNRRRSRGLPARRHRLQGAADAAGAAQ